MSQRSTYGFARRLSALALAVACLAAGSSLAYADDPDLRQFEPFVMVIVDTSGSMERLPSCQCTTPGCEECLPKCGTPAIPVPPTGTPLVERKNRWGFTLEALTGQFSDFQCNTVTRTSGNGATYDLGYYLPYHQPWKCTDGSLVCAMPAGTVADPTQEQNGVLDRYASRLRFGLMTFDGIETYQGANPLIHATSFNESLSESQIGMWSYAGPKTYRYPGCSQDYKMDTGARSSLATEGGLITLNSNACPSPPCSMYQINDTIQSTLLRTRPYGGTPIAASLDDLFYHFKTDLTDTLAGCRSRYALLITDGYPDEDFRQHGCDCKKEGNCPMDEDPDLLHCPYPLPEEAAYRLVNGYQADPKQMKQLFVIGISIDDQRVKDKLNLIASQGGSTLEDENGNVARFADGFDTLTATLDQLFSSLTEPVSRAVPAFTTSHLSGYTFRLTAGFQKATGNLQNGVVPPWTGIIERQRFLCETTTVPVGADLDTSKHDRFHVELAARPDTGADMRKLYTAFPTGTLTTGLLQGTLKRGVDGAVCGEGSSDYCALRELDPTTPKMDTALLNITASTAAERDAQRQLVMDWMYGRTGSVRKGQNMGDVYHSSPTFARPSVTTDTTDDSYNLFRERAEVSRKPLVMYIGSNDGVLHAFSVESYNGAAASNIMANSMVTYDEGEEMWGFVPPMLIPTIQDQLYGHQYGVDGTPVVKDVLFHKSTAPTGDEYHTVLATGLRAGGKGYFALDVSDPINPKFLWQFTDPLLPKALLGYTYGKPVLAQLDVDYMAGTDHIQGVRAVAILAGGRGTKWDGVGTAPPGCNSTTMLTPSARNGTSPYFTYGSPTDQNDERPHRTHVPCWNTEGRALFFVDVETGYLIKTIWSDDNGATLTFPSPVVGSPTVYPDSIGTIAKQGFVMDADGVLWRMDLASTDPDDWEVRPFHDLFWDLGPAKGETTYEIPLLTLDENKNLLVIVATGDTDNFDKPTVQNRVVSLTQLVDDSNAVKTPDDYKAAINWEMDGDKSTADSLDGMITSELVTGSMALFEGRLFFATFAPKVSSDPCQIGRGRLWSVHYKDHRGADANLNNTYPPKLVGLSAAETDPLRNSSASGVGFFNVDISSAPDNTMVFGLGATQLRCPRENTLDDITNYFGEKLPDIEQTGAPSIWIVAQTSGNSQLVQGGSVLGSINVQLDRATSFAKMTSWAASCE